MTTKTAIAAVLLAFFGLTGKTAPSEIKTKTLEDKLYEIGMESAKDNIERGGLVSGQNVYEIENDVRHFPEKFKSFMNGDNKHYPELKSKLLFAYSVRCVCNPEFTHAYTIYSIDLDNKLDIILTLPDEQRKKLEGHTKWLFEHFLPYGIYMANPEQQSIIQAKIGESNEPIGFHTHTAGEPPSLQDIKISHSRKEYVVSVNKEGKYTLYLVDKGRITTLYER